MTKSTRNGRTVEYMRGTGPGGQNRNKIESACRITDDASGISAYADCRTREASYRMALAELEKRIAQAKADAQAKVRKDRRDVAIHDHTIVRTYNFSRGLVKDHRSGKEATVKEILGKGRLDLLR
jgi:protein subunit release factor A